MCQVSIASAPFGSVRPFDDGERGVQVVDVHVGRHELVDDPGVVVLGGVGQSSANRVGQRLQVARGAGDVPDLDVMRGERGRRLPEKRAQLVGFPATLVGAVEEPVRQELELEVGEAVVVQELGDLAQRPGLEHVLEVGVPETDPGEADARGVGAAVAQVEEAPLAAIVRLCGAGSRPVQPDHVGVGGHVVNLTGLAGSVQPFSLTAMVADYVIVGAGSAGCVLASRLTEDDGMRVVLLEAGVPDTAPEIHVPAMFPIMFKSSLDWDLLGEPEPGLDGRRLYLPRGRMIGGSQLDQRDDLPARQPTRLRRLGRAGLRGLELRRGPAVLQARGRQRARRGRLPRGRWPAVRLRQPLDAPARRPDARGRDPGGPPRQPGSERRGAGRRRPLPAHAARWPSLQHGGRLPPPGCGPAEPRGEGLLLRRADRLRRQPRCRRRRRPERHTRDDSCRARGDRLAQAPTSRRCC